MTYNHVPGKEAYLMNTHEAIPRVQDLYSGGKGACFVVEVTNDRVVATSPVGWRLRNCRWSDLLKEFVDTGVIIQKFQEPPSLPDNLHPDNLESITEKQLWRILDGFCVQESAKGEGNYNIGLVENIEKAMKWLKKPTPEECRIMYQKDLRR